MSLDITRESFNGHPINLIRDPLSQDQPVFIQAVLIAQALEYENPKVAVRNILNRNPQDFEGFVYLFNPELKNFNVLGVANLAITSAEATNVFLTSRGADHFAMVSNQRKAVQLRRWFSKVLQFHREETPELVPNNPLAVLEQMNQQVALSLQIMRDQSQQLQIQNQRLNYQDLKIDQLERLTRSTYIDDTQAYHIKRRVDQLAYAIAENDGITKPNQIIFTSIWRKFHEVFSINKYRQLPKARYYDAIGLLDEHIRNEGAIPPKEC